MEPTAGQNERRRETLLEFTFMQCPVISRCLKAAHCSLPEERLQPQPVLAAANVGDGWKPRALMFAPYVLPAGQRSHWQRSLAALGKMMLFTEQLL